MVCHGCAPSLWAAARVEFYRAVCFVLSSLRQPHTLPFPPLRILGADNGDLGWPDYPPLHLPGRAASELRGKYTCVVDTGDTMDTRHAPKPTTALYWLPPKEKDLNSGWGISTDTHTLPNIAPLNNKKVNERQGQVPTSKMLIFVLQVCKASACVCVCAMLVLVFSCADKLIM